ncbi:HypC/HybG/HupF family hydrogenase formation chaperone [Thiococcus pfennigii]|uniref:HypC/HybG/HupF family hydrogenase formation chaperone n=1 Tax=Thiococcus pfennigii TaxID=1057 RepID=UPI0019062DCA|nr:HypC/HybG/HupF family hydrogenase formation chaperone [Thiococcus pfennigii]MBK1702799.1 hydrogenase assembly protein HupF [Thiococcus pfennigii]MBK1733276.1 hydrogenase assembly protein HupF [Thiococcus pfennigii]
MCLAIPARITAIAPSGQEATVTLGDVAKVVSLALVDDVAVGDYVLLHVGYALSKVSAEEAERTLALMVEAGLMEAPPSAAPSPTDAR